MTRRLIIRLGVVMLVVLVPTAGLATEATEPRAALESCLSAAGLELASGGTPTISGAAGIGIDPGEGPLMPGDLAAGVFAYGSEEEARSAAAGITVMPFHEVTQEGSIVVVYGEAPSADVRSAIDGCVAALSGHGPVAPGPGSPALTPAPTASSTLSATVPDPTPRMDALASLPATEVPLIPAGSPGPPCVPPPAGSFKVGSVVWDASLPFLGGYLTAQADRARCLGIGLDIRDARGAPDDVASEMAQLVDARVDLIIVATFLPEAIAGAISNANAAGIPVITTFVAPIDEAGDVTFVGYDAHDIGRQQGNLLAATVGDEARIGVIRGSQGSWSADVADGLREQLRAHEGIELIEREVAAGDESELQSVIEEWLSTYPPGGLAAIVIGETGAVSAADRVQELGRGDVRVIGGWYDEGVDAAISDGRMLGTILEDPRQIGAVSIEASARRLGDGSQAGSSGEERLTPTIVTRANVDEYPAWEAWPISAEADGRSEPTPAVATNAPSEPVPTPLLLRRSDLEDQAYRMCLRARPRDPYAVTSKVARATAARGMDKVLLVQVEYRDLGGTRRREPAIAADSVYDLRWSAPFDWVHPEQIGALACLALEATRLESWQNTSTQARHTIAVSDAIIWMVDASDGRMIGRAWRIHVPKPKPTNPGSPVAIAPLSEFRLGKHGRGIMPPSDERIIREVKRFLGS